MVRPGHGVAREHAVEQDGDHAARLRRPGNGQVLRGGDAVSLALAGVGADAGADCGWVSMTTFSVEDGALVVPAMSMAVAVTLKVPSARPEPEVRPCTRPRTEPSSDPTIEPDPKGYVTVPG